MLLGIAASAVACAQTPRTDVVLLAVPTRVDFLKSESGPVGDDVIQVSNLYRVHVRVATKLQGAGEVRKQMDVVLSAAHARSIPIGKPIVLVLDSTASKAEVLYWGHTKQLACLPTEVAEQTLDKEERAGLAPVDAEECFDYELPE